MQGWSCNAGTPRPASWGSWQRGPGSWRRHRSMNSRNRSRYSTCIHAVWWGISVYCLHCGLTRVLDSVENDIQIWSYIATIEIQWSYIVVGQHLTWLQHDTTDKVALVRQRTWSMRTYVQWHRLTVTVDDHYDTSCRSSWCRDSLEANMNCMQWV